MFKELTTEQIEVRVWATIVLVLATILLISVICILLAVMFVEQDMERFSRYYERHNVVVYWRHRRDCGP